MENNFKETKKNRFAYLDIIRSLVIILVIAMHSAVTYSGFGSWYYTEGSPEKLSVFGMAFFGFFQSFLQAWSMGILFFISGFLAVKSLVKHGSEKFIKERLFRLGLPLLIYVFLISPFIYFVMLGNYSENSLADNYILFIIHFGWLNATGPLWFVEVLLLFCIIYTIVKKCIPALIKIQNFNSTNIILIILFTGIISFFVRLIFPIGSSFYNLQFSYFTSYIVLFIVGILIGENNLLENITNEKNIKWLKLTLIIGIPFWSIIMLFGGALEGKMYFNGGFCWQSFAFALWESFTAIGFSLGLISFFKKNADVDNNFTRLIADNAFGIYFFHAPLLIAVSIMLRGLALNPLLKFIIVTILASGICLIFSFFVRKVKPIKILLK